MSAAENCSPDPYTLATDVLGRPWSENRFCPPDQRWTTFLTFTSPFTLLDDGALRYDDSTKEWSVHRTTNVSHGNNDDENDENDEREHTIPQRARQNEQAPRSVAVSTASVERMLLDDSVATDSRRCALLNCVRGAASAYPFVVVTVETLRSKLSEDFGCVQSATGTALLERFVTLGTCEDPLDALRKSFVDGHVDGEWYGTPHDSSTLVDRLCAADAHRTSAPRSHPLGDVAVVAEENAEPIATAISIQLNDSMLSKVLALDSDAKFAVKTFRKRVFPCLRKLQHFKDYFAMRASPSDVLLHAPIPMLNKRHGMKLCLFDYQRRSVHWMLDIEQASYTSTSGDGSIVVPDPKHVCWQHVPMRFRSDGYHRNDCIAFDSTPPSFSFSKLHVRGGVLAAKTGTGKTITAIALIHLQRCFERAATNDMCAERRPSDGVRLPAHRLPPKWIEVPSQRYYAACTLVVAPRQVVRQWADEFSKTLDVAASGITVRVIRTFTDVRALTIDEICNEIDVLIVNKHLFASNNYRLPRVKNRAPGMQASARFSSLSEKYSYRWRDDDLLDFVVRNNRTATERNPHQWPPGSFFESPVLHAIYWRRLIVDEMHELDRRWSMVERAVASLKAAHVWGLTATPNFDTDAAFGGSEASQGYPALLNVTQGSSDLGGKLSWVRWYFCQRHAVTVNACVGMLQLHLHRVDVRLSATEMAIYSSIPQSRHRRRLLFCSHHVLEDEQWTRYLEGGGGDGGNNRGADLSAALSEKNAMGVDQVAQAMQYGRLSRVNKLRSVLLSLVRRWHMSKDDVLNEIDGAHPIIRSIFTTHMDDPLVAVRRFLENDTVALCNITADDRKDAQRMRERRALQERQRAVRRRVAAGEFDVDVHRAQQLALLSQVNIHMEAMRNLERRIKAQGSRMHTALREYNFFDAVFRQLSRPNDTVECPICLDDETTQKTIVLTACGHKFCAACAREHFSDRRTCPQCRKQLRIPDDLRTIDRYAVAPPTSAPSATASPAAQAVGEGGAADQNDETKRYGSKLGRLFALVREIRARADFNKLIIYAQFERLLRLVGNALSTFGISFVYVKGSIHECERAIRRFKNDDGVKIMLLSSENTISGVHLVEANHLIAVHPPLGNVEEAYAMQWQAIGRIRRLVQQRECHVWNMVTVGTLEERLYAEQTQYARGKHERDENISWAQV